MIFFQRSLILDVNRLLYHQLFKRPESTFTVNLTWDRSNQAVQLHAVIWAISCNVFTSGEGTTADLYLPFQRRQFLFEYALKEVSD